MTDEKNEKLKYATIKLEHMLFSEKIVAKMDLSKIELGRMACIYYKDGDKVIGTITDFTSSWDNDDEGAYITIVPENGKLKGEYIECPENEIKFAEYLE